MSESLLHFCFNSVVVCLAGIVTIGRDVEKPWKWFQELGRTYGLATNGTRGGS